MNTALSDIFTRIKRSVIKWDITKLIWNPSTQHSEKVATAWSEKTELFAISEAEIVSTDILTFHTKTVTDIDWNACDPNLLASASLDETVNIWDLRTRNSTLTCPISTLEMSSGVEKVRNSETLGFRH